MLLIGKRAHLSHHAANDLCSVNGVQAQLKRLTGVESRQVEQVVHEPGELFSLLVDNLHEFRASWFVFHLAVKQ